MGDQIPLPGTLTMARLTVAVLLVFTAFACASIPEMYEVAEPDFVEELVQEQAAPQTPTVDQDKTNMNSKPDQLGDVETFKVVNKKHVAVPPEAGDENAYKAEGTREATPDCVVARVGHKCRAISWAEGGSQSHEGARSFQCQGSRVAQCCRGHELCC